MLVGFLSDSHGRWKITGRAVAQLRAAGAQVLVHLGDVETEAVIDELVGHNAHLVLGNCDMDEAGLTRYARHVGVHVDHPSGELLIVGKRIAFTHGHVSKCMDQALASGVDYLVHGHTHEVRDERMGSTRVINPGALFRASRYTVALLDPVADSLRFLEVVKGDGPD